MVSCTVEADGHRGSKCFVVSVTVFLLSSRGRSCCWFGSGNSDNTFMGAAVAFLLFRKKPSKFWAIATALAIVGVCLINFGGGFQSQTLDWKVLLPVAAGLCYGVEIIAVGKVVEKINPETTMLLEMGLVAILLLPVTFFFPSEWIFTTRGILVSLGLGVVTAGIAYPCFTYGIKYTSPVAASTLALTEPLMAAALGIFFLHENLTIPMALGMLSLIASVIVLIFDGREKSSL